MIFATHNKHRKIDLFPVINIVRCGPAWRLTLPSCRALFQTKRRRHETMQHDEYGAQQRIDGQGIAVVAQDAEAERHLMNHLQPCDGQTRCEIMNDAARDAMAYSDRSMERTLSVVSRGDVDDLALFVERMTARLNAVQDGRA